MFRSFTHFDFSLVHGKTWVQSLAYGKPVFLPPLVKSFRPAKRFGPLVKDKVKVCMELFLILHSVALIHKFVCSLFRFFLFFANTMLFLITTALQCNLEYGI